MPRPTKSLTNMEIDEISLVDKGANQHAMITIAKRATEEDQMPKLYNEEGAPLDENALEYGDIVYDGDGAAYEFVAEEEEPVVEKEEKELAEVGKSAFLEKKEVKKSEETSFSKALLDELSKAFTDEDRDQVIAKALGRVEQLDQQLHQYQEVAKSERDLRLTREYISKAAEYNVPIDANELGPVLYRMAESMSYEDCAVINKALESVGDMLFEEIGFTGGGDNGDIMSMVEAKAVEIGKSASPENVSAVFDQNPSAYDEYLAAQRDRF